MADIWISALALFLANTCSCNSAFLEHVSVLAFWLAKLTKKAGGICWQPKLANTEADQPNRFWPV